MPADWIIPVSMPGLTHDDVVAMLSGLLREHLAVSDWGANLDVALARADRSVAAAAADMFGLGPDVVEELVGLAQVTAWADTVLGLAGARPERLTFRTSGSTGQPVAHTHATALLWQEMATQAEFYPGRTRVVGFVPCHHIYGFLFLVLLPKALGVPVVLLPPLPTVAHVRRLQPGDLAVAFPLFWKGLAQVGAAFAPRVQGVTSTGPCPAEVILTLQELGLERCTEIYGSSETAGIGFRHAPGDTYTLLDYWASDPGAELGNGLVRALPDGGRATYPLPDHVAWASPRTFTLAGRRDRAVQVGGVNVYPERVREVLQQHPAVAACMVRLMRPEEGSRLKAFVVPNDPTADSTALRRVILAWLEPRLTPAETPKALAFGDRLPATALGKAADWDLTC
ncbi:MAG: AMP-binding protein [Thermodesulfobacteriota bacterium]